MDHPVQNALVDAVPNGVRFPVVPAGRRSGKTERAKRFVVREAFKNSDEMYFFAAPTRDQVKKIFWDDAKALAMVAAFPKRPSESDLVIYIPNGTEIHLIGLDRPERFEGIPWTGGVIDEIGNIKEDAWEANILPALNTVTPSRPDYRAWCWLIGVPEGLNHYYDMAQYAESGDDPEWALFHWKSAEILPADVIESAKRQMSPKQFRQEFEASFEGASGRIYEDYGKQNYTKETIKPHEQILFAHDFNYSPMSSCIAVIREESIYVVDEIILTSAVARQSALEFVERYRNHKNKRIQIYGDASGRAGEKHSQASDYTEIEKVLRDNGWSYSRRVPAANPPIKERQNSLRAKIMNAAGDVSLFVNPKKCPYVHRGLSTVQFKKGSAFQEEETDYQHVITAVGYMCNVLFPSMGNQFRSGATTGYY